MSRAGHVRFTPALTEQARALLLGLNPTPARVAGLLTELAQRRTASPEVPMDDEDRELGRVPTRRITVDHEAAAARLAEQQKQRPKVEPGSEPTGAAGVLGDEDGTTRGGGAAAMVARDPGTPGDSGSVDDDATVEALKQQIAEGAFRGHMETVERKALARLPRALRAGGKAATLDEAAALLLAEMQPNHQDAVRLTAENLTWPVWAVMLGAVAHVADLQELAGGNVESHWIDGTQAARASKPKAAVCVRCQGEIPDARPGQQACCNLHGSGKDEHSESCRLKHRLRVKGEWVEIAQLKD